MELDGARYLNFNLPFSISQLVWIEAILVGGAEIYRNRELDPETRIYPGPALTSALQQRGCKPHTCQTLLLSLLLSLIVCYCSAVTASEAPASRRG